MNHRRQTLFRSGMALIAGIAVTMAGSARAQDEESPKAKAKAKPAAKAKAAAKADKGDRPTKKSATQKAGQAIERPPAEDPVVKALLESNPKAPADCFRAAQILVRLQRPELAKGFLKKVLDAKLNDEQLAALVEQYKSAAFTEMASNTELLPEAENLAQQALGATNRRLQDPKRLDSLIKQLQSPTAEARNEAINGLKDAHGAAVSALVAVLADPLRAGEHPVARAALVEMRSEAIDPLADILDRASAPFMVQAIEALAAMRASTATLYLLAPALSEKSDRAVRAAAVAALGRLLGPLPSKSLAAEQLCETARRYFQQKVVMKTDLDDRVTLWHWDAEAKQCVATNVPLDAACRTVAARLARDALALAPDSRPARTLCLATGLEQAVHDAGLDRPLDFEKNPAVRQAVAAGTEAVEAVLAYAMAEDHPAAGRAAAEILGRIGKAQDVLHHGAAAAPLVRAAQSPDRRVCMAAIEAILRLQPTAPFAGSSYVLDTLCFLTATTGARRALLVTGNNEMLQDWLGGLAAMHYETDTVTTGRECMRRLTTCPDYELVVIDAGVVAPGLDMTVQQVRQDHRTATMRVAVVARSGFFDQAEHAAREDSRVRAFARPHSAEDAQWQIRQLLAIEPREFIGFPQRQDQAARALACLAVLAASPHKLYDMRQVEEAVSKGIYVPGLGGRAAVVLMNVGTRNSQIALAELASQTSQPLPVRKTALKALRISVRKFGLLLPQDAIRRQYERYDQSASQDLDTQQMFGSILDLIEVQPGMAKPGETKKTEKTEEKKPDEKKKGEPEKKK
jgi:hypothetical protein